MQATRYRRTEASIVRRERLFESWRRRAAEKAGADERARARKITPPGTTIPITFTEPIPVPAPRAAKAKPADKRYNRCGIYIVEPRRGHEQYCAMWDGLTLDGNPKYRKVLVNSRHTDNPRSSARKKLTDAQEQSCK